MYRTEFFHQKILKTKQEPGLDNVYIYYSVMSKPKPNMWCNNVRSVF